MPRKTIKTEKPTLQFLEQPVGGARLQNVPEVRAANNPKEFFTDTSNNSRRSSWVSPQFDSSAALPVRRGRRKCHSVTSILNSSQLSRKNTRCKYPSLSFESRSRDHQPKPTLRKNATESAVSTKGGNRPLGSCQNKSAGSLETPKRQLAPARKKTVRRCCDGAASSSRCLDEAPPIQVTGRTPAFTPASSEASSPDVSSVCPLPDVDTPKVIQEENSCPSSPAVHRLLAQPRTPPHNQPPDILVADTPERDYGLKVTWRRRSGLMSFLKERGHLSDSDVLIHSG
ncbi:RAD9, HUS1, RAD1-interacting nuclear orphan protein 1 [Aulostomus maculatus]